MPPAVATEPSWAVRWRRRRRRRLPPCPPPLPGSHLPPRCWPLAAGRRGRTRAGCRIPPFSLFNFPLFSLPIHGSDCPPCAGHQPPRHGPPKGSCPTMVGCCTTPTTCCGAPPPPSSLAPWSLSFSIDGRGHILCSKGSRKNYQEYVQLKSRVEILQHSQRNLLGEDLAPLSTSELEQLESQVDKTLKQIRSRKTQVLLDELCDLKRKEEMLQDANRVLKRKLDEVDAEAVAPPPQLLWQGGSSSGDAMLSDGPPQPEHFFQALESNPLSLQPTFHTMDMNQQPAPGSCYLPAWMA